MTQVRNRESEMSDPALTPTDKDLLAMLGGNAIEFYGLDAEKLAPTAARIGPEKGTFNETHE